MGDKRDGYRADVDREVLTFAALHGWDAAAARKAQRICYRTIFAESDWRNLANPLVPASLLVLPNDGNGKDLDSTGLYQQRSSQGWGSVVGSMNPAIATERFLGEMLRAAPGWLTEDESTVCQKVQRSSFADASNYHAGTAQVNALEADLKYFEHLTPSG